MKLWIARSIRIKLYLEEQGIYPIEKYKNNLVYIKNQRLQNALDRYTIEKHIIGKKPER